MHLNKLFFVVPAELNSSILIGASNLKTLVLKNVKTHILFYINIPANIFVSIKNENFFCFASFSTKCLNSFLVCLSKQVSSLRFPFFKKLFLKVLGFRIKLLN